MTKNNVTKRRDSARQASSIPSQSTQANSQRVPKRMASEEEQRQFANNYGSELVIKFGPSVGTKNVPTLLDELIEFCGSERRIAPLPEYWDAFCRLVMVDTEEAKRLGPLPNTDYIYDTQRRKRLIAQIEHASDNGSLKEADKFLRSLTLNQWLLDPWA